MGGSREGDRGSGPLRKSQVANIFLQIIVQTYLKKQLDLRGLGGGLYSYLWNIMTTFSGSAHWFLSSVQIFQERDGISMRSQEVAHLLLIQKSQLL